MQKKFLISSCCGIGNFIQKTPMIKSIHNIFPDVNMDVIVCETNNPLFKYSQYNTENILSNSQYINKNIFYKNKNSIFSIIKFVLEIRKNN